MLGTFGGGHRATGSARCRTAPGRTNGLDLWRVWGVGSFAVQLAKSYGAEVTAVCSPKNVEMVRSMGADQVIDYTQEGATRNRQRYDLILGVNGYQSLFAYRHLLTPKGRYVMIGASKKRLLQAFLQSMVLGPMISKLSRQHMRISSTHMTQTDLTLVKELVEEGKVVPVIDNRYPLAEAAAAFRYVNDVHAQGKVVITVEENTTTELPIR